MNRIQVPIFELNDVNVSFDNRIALKISKFQFHRGTIYGIVGPVGSGKTTLLKVLSGRLEPSGGQLLYEKDIFKKSWLGKIKPIDDINFIDGEMAGFKGSVGEFLKMNLPDRIVEVKKNYYTNTRHSTEWDLSMDSLSSGMKYRANLIVAIESDPKVLVIDDYGTYFDVRLRREFNRRIMQIVKLRGTTVIISTTEANSLREFSSVILFLDNGHISKVRSQKK